MKSVDGQRAEALIVEAVECLSRDGQAADLDSIPLPVYTTDAEGAVTYWNRACVDFAGREPQLGTDRWCVTWQIYTTEGEFLPHDRCPMAVAIQEKRSIRNAVAIALRPDGSRVAFTPYPTPLFDADGNLTGAVNMLVDVSKEQSVELHIQAERCRRLAQWSDDMRTRDILSDMAINYAATANALAGA